MEGVEILKETLHYVYEYHARILVVSIIISAIVCFFIAAYRNRIFEWREGMLGAGCGIIIGTLIGGLLMATFPTKTDEISYIEYRVTISDDVKFNEFTATYEILGQDGKIYTVKERK